MATTTGRYSTLRTRCPADPLAEAYAVNGLLVLCFDYSKVPIDEFNDWYDTEHIPERQQTKGFLTAKRWLDVGNRFISAAVYDLVSVDVLREPEYLAISGGNLTPWSKRIVRSCTQLLRFEGTQLYPGQFLAGESANFLLLASVGPGTHDARAQRQASLEHAARMAEVPGVHSVRSFECTNGATQILELYELEAPEVASSAHWGRADALHSAGRLSERANLKLLCDRYRR